MSEAAIKIGLAAAGAIARRLLKKRRKKKEEEEEKKEEEGGEERERRERLEEKRKEDPLYYIFPTRDGIEYTPLSIPGAVIKGDPPRLVYQDHPELGDLDRWKRYASRHRRLSHRKGGHLFGIPMTAGVTGIILTRDGRLFPLPHGRDAIDTAYRIWQPFLTYLERRAEELSKEKNIPFMEALQEILRENGIDSTVYPDENPVFQLESVYFAGDEPEEKKKNFLRFLKRIYMDEMGLDWMPLPLNAEHHYEKFHHIERSNSIYLRLLPDIMRELGINPEDPLVQLRLRALDTLLKVRHPQYWDVRESLALIEQLHREGRLTDEEYRKILEDFTQNPQTVLETARKLAGEEKEEEEAPHRTLAYVIAEKLPGWAIKQALDEYKKPLYTDPDTGTVHPSLIKYHLERINPDSPLGTLLHPLITQVLSKWEEQAAHGEQPSHPYDLITQLIGRPPEEIAERLTPRRAERIMEALGIAPNTTIPALAKILKEIGRDLKQLKENPQQHSRLDTEKEAALRYYQLGLLAKGEPHPETREIIEDGLIGLPETYKQLREEVLKQTRVGREKQEEVLNRIEKILREKTPHLIRQLGNKKISEAVTEILDEARKELEDLDTHTRSWALNFLENTLLDAPIIAAAKGAEDLPIEEKQRIAAALMKLYEEEGKKHHIAPVTTDLHGMWKAITEAAKGKEGEEKKKAMLEIIGKIRRTVNATANAMINARNLIEPLGSGEHLTETEKGLMLRREITRKLEKAKEKILRTVYRV